MNKTKNRCVYCGDDTSFGSGKFVNRLAADADCLVEDNGGNVIYQEGEHRDGYSCADCMMQDCCRCGKLIELDEDVTPFDLFGLESEGEFDDGAFRVHEKCLTEKEFCSFLKIYN